MFFPKLLNLTNGTKISIFQTKKTPHFLDEELAQEQTPDNQNIKIAIVGRPNVGKSTLTNRILGEDRVVVYDMPGTPATVFTFQWNVMAKITR